MKLLGLTGNIACGKSSVAVLLQARGAHIIDADKLVHELYSNLDFSHSIAKVFGPGVLQAAGTIDRKKLGAIVFGEDAALKKLEAIVHPAVAALREEKLRALEKTDSRQVAVLEAVKLVESGQAKGCDAVWCVMCSPQTQLKRLMEMRALNEVEARARLASQPDFDEKKRIVSALKTPLVSIPNDGDVKELAARVEKAWNEFAQVVCISKECFGPGVLQS